MNLLLKVSSFFHNLQVKVLLKKYFLFQKALLITCTRLAIVELDKLHKTFNKNTVKVNFNK